MTKGVKPFRLNPENCMPSDELKYFKKVRLALSSTVQKQTQSTEPATCSILPFFRDSVSSILRKM
jgi:hypothetical protein